MGCHSLPSPGDLPDPGLELLSPTSPAVAGGFFTSAAPGKPSFIYDFFNFSQRFLVFFLIFIYLAVSGFCSGLQNLSLQHIGIFSFGAHGLHLLLLGCRARGLW